MAKAGLAAQTCNDPVKLIGLVTKAGKDMFMVCFSKADKKTKVNALPLLQKINNVEIAAIIFDEVVRPEAKDNLLTDAYLAKLQRQTAKIQDDLAAVKAKMACNENSEKQTVKEEFKQFCDALDDVESLLHTIDNKRIGTECKSHSDEKVYQINMQMIQADICLLESERSRNKSVAELRDLTETRKLAELRLIDAFEESAMESESRQLIEADRHKKKLEARCVKMEKNHTEIEMAHMELGKERRDTIDGYLDEVRQRFGILKAQVTQPGIASAPSILKKREAEHGGGVSPAIAKKRDHAKSRGNLKKRETGSRHSSPKI
ncbi:uncharacterized protein [Amphiura filiformis]|uniref:uncharacterized protein n=1 Tax=Amphiura filiformis TaxID=82378 RepID=UPI003B21C421